jgi:outer membrane receptor protein involved in Fe transport
MLKRLLFVLLCVATTAPYAFAGTTGKIVGRVTDRSSGEPMIGVNITLLGTTLGAASDEKGEFFVLNVPAGVYTMNVSMIGYAPMSIEKILIVSDMTLRQNITMSQEAVSGEEVVVTAERPLVQLDRTSSISLVTASEIEDLPVRGIEEITALQAGVVEWEETGERKASLHFRGGRGGETAFIIDGVVQNDPLTGESSTTLNNNAIEEIVVLNSGYNAEYGRFMSGIVNVVTKSGTGRWLGSFEAESDAFSGGWNGSDVYGYNVWSGALGSPLPLGKGSRFYASTEIRDIGDKYPGMFDDGMRPKNSDGNRSNEWNGYSTQAKVTFEPTRAFRLDVTGIFTKDTRRDYFEWFKYDLDNMQRRKDKNNNLGIKFTGVLNDRNYFEARLNYFYTQHQEGDNELWDDFPNTIGRAVGEWNASEFSFMEPGTTREGRYDPFFMFFSPGASWDDYTKEESNHWAGKFDYTSQVTSNHELKLGLEYIRHSIRHYRDYAPSSGPKFVNSYGYSYDPSTAGPFKKDDNFNEFDGVKNPKVITAYIQDKIEYEGLIVNAGLRLDYLDANTNALKSLSDPTGSLMGGSNDPETVDAADFGDNRTFTRISPRLGISFPISDKTVMHFNYGRFFQQPNLENLYVGTILLERLARGFITSQLAVPQPNLKPEENTSYEVGINHQLSERSRVAVTGYYRSIQNLIDMELIENTGVGGSGLSMFSNLDYGTVRGLDVAYELRQANRMTMRLNYGISYAVGTGSQNDSNFNNTWLGYNTAKAVAPLDFDQRHTVSLAVDYATQKDDGPTWGNSHPFGNLDANVLFRVRSGLPYTPDVIHNSRNRAAVPDDFPIGGTNSQYSPWNLRMDLKASKSFTFSNGLRIMPFVKVINLLDKKNPVRVYSATGAADDDGFLGTAVGEFLADTYASSASQFGGKSEFLSRYNDRLLDSLMWDVPRQFRFGILMDF